MNTVPSTGIASITPEIATDWLDHRNKGNRHVADSVVNRYAEAMASGRWMVTHQGIAFDEEGFLLDGQHRLWAVIESGATVDIHVTTGIPRASFTVLDTGRKRAASQLIDHPQRITIASAARILGYLDGTTPPGLSVAEHVVPIKVDNDHILAVYDAWPEMGAWANSVLTAHRAASILPSAHLAVIAQAARSRYADLVPAWFDGINTGAGLDATDPRLVLRNRCITGIDIRGHGSIRMGRAYQMIVKAWNAFALGKPVKILKILPQKPPTVVGFESTGDTK